MRILRARVITATTITWPGSSSVNRFRMSHHLAVPCYEAGTRGEERLGYPAPVTNDRIRGAASLVVMAKEGGFS